MSHNPLIESPINYMGSKYKLLDKLIPLFPKNKKRFYDMFMGGGSIYMNVAHLYPKVIANESLEGVYNIHLNLNNGEYIKKAAALSQETKLNQIAYNELRDMYNLLPKRSEYLLALIWSCNSNMMRFNKNLEFNQTWGRRSYNSNTAKKLSKYREKNYNNVKFKNKSYVDVKVKQNSFIYLDPPYHNTEAGYNSLWSHKEENQLLSYLECLIHDNISFGISGVLNNKENKIFDYLKTKNTNTLF